MQVESIFWPLRALAYVFPHYFALPALTYHVYLDGSDFDGTERCECASLNGSSTLMHGRRAQTAACTDGVSADCPRGFLCPDVAQNMCFGRTGEEVLTGLQTQYDAPPDPNS